MLKMSSKIIVLLLIAILCVQCGLFQNERSEPLEIQRFEEAFYAIDTNDFRAGVEKIASTFPDFYPVFIENVLNIAADHTDYDSYILYLYEFRAHPSMIGLHDSIRKHYPNLTSYARELSSALGIFQRKFPHYPDLEVVSFVSEFGNKAILYDGGIGISLDMFLGVQYPYYQGMQMPGYIIDYLVPEQVVPNAVRVLAEDFVAPQRADATFLDMIVTEGKKLYFAETLLPKRNPEDLIEYSTAQYQWCIDNESQIWGHFLDNEILYNTRYTQYRRYLEPAPTTRDMPAESPGQVGAWTGWQIVRSYMKRNPNTSLEKLFALSGQELLEKAAYKPR